MFLTVNSPTIAVLRPVEITLLLFCKMTIVICFVSLLPAHDARVGALSSPRLGGCHRTVIETILNAVLLIL
ncbi:hypothetical protein DID99_34915 [Burkholderia sp. Bp8986]|nr:hypothetical protein DID99_34915 [Burkholderia sp. Bp8986]